MKGEKMNSVYWITFETPLGSALLAEKEGAIVHFGLPGQAKHALAEVKKGYPEAEERVTSLLLAAREQVFEYLLGTRKKFDLTLVPEGTPFQKKVWEALKKIPYGETKTYGELAKELGLPHAARAIGGACNKNPIALLIPCHRVVGHDGKLVGFGGGIPLKEKFLALEAESKKQRRPLQTSRELDPPNEATL